MTLCSLMINYFNLNELKNLKIIFKAFSVNEKDLNILNISQKFIF